MGRRREQSEQARLELEKAQRRPPEVNEMLINGVVMTPCSYCQQLIPKQSTTCPKCGGPIKIVQPLPSQPEEQPGRGRATIQLWTVGIILAFVGTLASFISLIVGGFAWAFGLMAGVAIIYFLWDSIRSVKRKEPNAPKVQPFFEYRTHRDRSGRLVQEAKRKGDAVVYDDPTTNMWLIYFGGGILAIAQLPMGPGVLSGVIFIIAIIFAYLGASRFKKEMPERITPKDWRR
jgi:rRNA maturation protein Nop10